MLGPEAACCEQFVVIFLNVGEKREVVRYSARCNEDLWEVEMWVRVFLRGEW